MHMKRMIHFTFKFFLSGLKKKPCKSDTTIPQNVVIGILHTWGRHLTRTHTGTAARYRTPTYVWRGALPRACALALTRALAA
jgi:hypothetical protein